jgi:polar amino acid transport system ATP-binding protein
MVGLLDKAYAYPLQLSGGQQQRVAIARALAIRPKVLMLDEPTSALDPELVDEVLKVLEDIARRGTTMLIVTHEVDFAEDVADRVLFFEGGRIVEEGPPEILYNPRSECFRQFLRRLHRRAII